MSETETETDPEPEQTNEDDAGEGDAGGEDQLSREQLEQKLNETEQKLAEAKDERDEFEEKFLRKTADYKNLRERKEEEMKHLKQYAGQDTLREVLDVLDNLDRTLSETDFKSDDVRDAVEMIHRQVEKLLNDQGVQRMEAEGERFDPEQHDAMMQQETDEYDDERVLEVVRAGYHFHDRVLRPARVVVADPVDESSENGETVDGGDESEEQNEQASDGQTDEQTDGAQN